MTNAKEREASLFLADVPEVAVRLRPAIIAYVGVNDPGGAREDAFLPESGTLVGWSSTSFRSIAAVPLHHLASKWLNYSSN